MRLRVAVTLLVSAAVAGAPLAPVSGLPSGKKQPGQVVVGTDPEGDWGPPGGAGAAGELLAQDLVKATIGMADKTTVNFVLEVTNLPPLGGWPEVTRYVWEFQVDGFLKQLDGKFANYTRGVCDPTSGCLDERPPRNPGLGPFFVREHCHPGYTGHYVCREIGLVNAIFDASAKTITIPVPLDLIGAQPGSKIAPAALVFRRSIAACTPVFFCFGGNPVDRMTVNRTFVVPMGRKK